MTIWLVLKFKFGFLREHLLVDWEKKVSFTKKPHKIPLERRFNKQISEG
jgi:hypothetical protein